MKHKLSIIKIGGNLLDNPQLFQSMVKAFSNIEGPKILVHGGGVKATRMTADLGIETKFHQGRRITSQANLETVTMVYAGLINKQIVSALQDRKCNAIGLSGCDGNAILASKRPPQPVDYGWVGDVKQVNTSLICSLLHGKLAPVFCAITHDGNGQLLNTNADTIAAEIAIAMTPWYATSLNYCFEHPGVLQDREDLQSVIKHINTQTYGELQKQQVITDGMLPKLENCFYALKKGVSRVQIGNVNALNNPALGTSITL